jgi:trimeric autotransporter adhesin
MRTITFCLFVILLCTAYNTTAQSLAINTDGSTANTSALLDVKSTDKGILIPRMSKTQKNAITSPATGLLIFQDAPDSTGFYYYGGSSWLWLNSNLTGWSTTGNSGIDTTVNFIGTTNNMPLRFKVNNAWAGQIDRTNQNVFMGADAGVSFTSGFNNAGFGHMALSKITTNFGNAAFGAFALQNSTANANTALGSAAMISNTTGTANVGVGNTALQNHRTGNFNTAVGSNAMNGDTTGSQNVAVGALSMFNSRNITNNVQQRSRQIHLYYPIQQ